MKKNLYSIIFLLFSLQSLVYSSEIKLNVNLLPTGQYNVSDFLNPSVSLWTVITECIDCPEEGLDYRLEVKLSFNDIQPAIWGVTYVRNLTMGGFDEMTNFDFQGGAGLLQDYTEDEDFIAQLEETYYLPAGNVELSVTAYEACPFSNSWRNDYKVDCTVITSDDSESFFSTFNNVVSEITLLSPANNGDVLDSYPWFRWESPGFTDGVHLDYKLYLYLFDPTSHSSYLDAIEDDNYLYFSADIREQFETGASRQIQIQYPSNDRELACGYEYVWFIEANDIIQDPPFNGETGIWGWPEPITSPLFTFSYGSTIRPDNIISPSIGSSQSTVRPSFHIDPIGCANAYEIWLSESEDSEVENPIWTSGALSSNINVYPSDVTGLIPNRNYKWKIRMNPDGEPSPWSDVFDFSISGYSLDAPISGEVLNSITPSFYFSVPMDIATYELRISNSDDPLVESANIYNETISSSGFQLPQDIPEGLLPGKTYYWKLIFFDGNDNIIGDIDDYTTVESFKIKDIELNSPSNGANNLTLTPSFMWDGIIGIQQYELSISDSDDSNIEDPFFVKNVSGTFFQYSQFSDNPLELGKSYYWRIIPLDSNENRGVSSEVFSFSTSLPTNEDFGDDDSDDDVFGSDSEDDIFGDGSDEIEIEEDEDIPEADFDDAFGDDSGEVETEEDEDIPQEDSGEEVVVEEDEDIPQEDSGEEVVVEEDEDISQEDSGEEVVVEEEGDASEEDSDDESISSSDAVVASSTEATGSYDTDMPISSKPEFAVSLSSAGFSKDIIIDLLAIVEGAEEYIISFSLDPSMGTVFEELNLVDYQTQATLDGSDLEWDLTVYIQISAILGGNLIGDLSSVQAINLPDKPGSNDQVGIALSLESGSTRPIIEIINSVLNASSYTMIVSTNIDMAEVYFSDNIDMGMPIFYPESAPQLVFGETYYFQVFASDDDGEHGIPSSITSMFIPNIISPTLGDSFSWDGTVPASNSYIIQFSTTDDFTSIDLEENVNGTSFIPPEGIFDYGTTYYWRVQGVDSENNFFGDPSSVSFFTTESVQAPTLNTLGDETSLLPEFSWEGVEQAVSYLISVSSDANLEEILWSDIITSTNAVYDESALLLSFSTTYYWSIATLSDDGSVLSMSSIESFSTTSLFPVSGLAPNGATEALTPTLSWELNTNIISYRVLISKDSEFNELVLDLKVETNSLTIENGLLESGLQYYWKVIGLDQNDENLVNPSEVALLVMPSNTEISLISPTENEQIGNLMPTFKWGMLENINSYKIMISTDIEMATLILDETISITEFTIPEDRALINGMTYYWQIQAITETLSIDSSIGIFSTPPEISISILSLDEGAEVSVLNPTFSWENIEGISAYNIEFSISSDFSESWLLLSGSSNFEYPSEPILEFNQVYYWRVCALNNEGDRSSEWTSPRSFSLSNIYIVDLESPASGEVVTTKTPAFSWGQIENVNQYEIRISSTEDYSETIWQTDNVSTNNIQYPSSGVEELLAETTYYWSIRAISEDSALGEFSESFNFMISEDNTPVLTGPMDEVSETIYPYFTWNKIPRASSYGLILGNDEDCKQVIIESSNITEKHFQYPSDAPPLDYDKSYYWKVIAYDEDENKLGDYSTIATFKTPSGVIEIEFIYSEGGD